MFMEDDMELCAHGMRAIHHAIEKANSYTDWSVVRVSYGMNGLIFQARDLPVFQKYLQNRLTARPPDHVVVEWFASETPESKTYLKGRPNMAFRHNLFLHLGAVSSIGKDTRTTPMCYEVLNQLMVDVESFNIHACMDDDISPCAMRRSPPKLISWERLCTGGPKGVGVMGVAPPPPVALQANIQPIDGGQGESCDAVCSRNGKTCVLQQLSAMNTCEMMKKVFPCEQGCSMHFGPEQPCYVSDFSAPASNLPRACLINTQIQDATCGASHHMTSRICPCA